MDILKRFCQMIVGIFACAIYAIALIFCGISMVLYKVSEWLVYIIEAIDPGDSKKVDKEATA